jgi:hypothetical protein
MSIGLTSSKIIKNLELVFFFFILLCSLKNNFHLKNFFKCTMHSDLILSLGTGYSQLCDFGQGTLPFRALVFLCVKWVW